MVPSAGVKSNSTFVWAGGGVEEDDWELFDADGEVLVGGGILLCGGDAGEASGVADASFDGLLVVSVA